MPTINNKYDVVGIVVAAAVDVVLVFAIIFHPDLLCNIALVSSVGCYCPVFRSLLIRKQRLTPTPCCYCLLLWHQLLLLLLLLVLLLLSLLLVLFLFLLLLSLFLFLFFLLLLLFLFLMPRVVVVVVILLVLVLTVVGCKQSYATRTVCKMQDVRLREDLRNFTR